MRVVNFLLAAMFLVFAFLQVDDPDPVVWILIYGAVATVCVMAIFEFYPRHFILALFVALLGYSVFYIRGVITWWGSGNRAALFDDVAKMEHVYIEEAREFLGLVICLIVLGIYLYRSRRR